MPIDYGLTGRVAIVTGAGSGIGLAAAEALLGEGVLVVGADREPGGLDGRAGATPYQIDLLDGPACEALVAAVMRDHGTIDILVNCVGGGAPQPDRLLTASDDNWRRTLELNLLTMVRMARCVLPHMVEAGRGVIVSVGSDEARQPTGDFVDYAAAKAAVAAVSKAIAEGYGPAGIRANLVSPGFTRTPMTEPFIEFMAHDRGTSVAEAEQFIVGEMKRMPLRRAGRPADVANVILFLASDLAQQVTGSDYRVDGGIVTAP